MVTHSDISYRAFFDNENRKWYTVGELAAATASRVSLSATSVLRAIAEVCSIRAALGQATTSGFVAGLFPAFLSTPPQMLRVQHQLGDRFPLFFAMIACSIGLASFLNSRLLIRLGIHWPRY